MIQFILYKTLVDNAFGGFSKEFAETVEAIHECLKAKQYGKVLTVSEGISNKISKNIYRPFKKEQDFINQLLLELIRKPKNELHEVAPWLDIFVFVKKYNFANIQNEIFGYIYENYLKVLYEDEQKGQYFTDPAVVNFMLKQLGFTPEAIKERYETDENSISLIDPSCGSGTFLYSAVNVIAKAFGNHSIDKSERVETIVNDNVFGLDIAEFPLYLAEMSMLMRMLPLILNEDYNNPIDKKIKVFKTRDSISEFLDTSLRNTLSDLKVEYEKAGRSQGQISMFADKLDLGYLSYVRDEDDLKEMKQSLENLASVPRRRFDYVIGNPPYISYNQSAKQNVLIFKLMKEGKAKLSDMYGINLHSTPDNRKKYPPKPNLYAFFIALGLALLKDDGKLCYIIPQTLLTESDYDVIRYHLSEFTTIETIVTFPGPLFVGRGLKQKNKVATSSLVLVVTRKTPPTTHLVSIYNYEKAVKDSIETIQDVFSGKMPKLKQISQHELRRNVGNWNFIKKSKDFIELYDVYKATNEDFSIYYNHDFSKQHFQSRFYFDVGFILDKKLITPNCDGECYELVDFNNFQGYSHYQPTSYYPSDQTKVGLPKNSQGYKTLDTKYKIVWSKVYSKRFYLTDRTILPSMSFCQFIASDNKREMDYLLSLFNSPINKLIFNELFQIDEEQYGSFLVVKRIKEFIRVPKITANNQHIKDKIIELTEELLELEKVTLSDLVDFSGVMTQKFNSVNSEDNRLILKRGDEVIKLLIKKDQELVDKIIKGETKGVRLDFENNKPVSKCTLV